MKDATYIKVKEGKLWASDQTEPVEPNYGDCEMDASDLHISGAELFGLRMKQWTEAMEAFSQSFIEVGNPEVIQEHLRLHFDGDGLHAVSGLQFEVREKEFYCDSVRRYPKVYRCLNQCNLCKEETKNNGAFNGKVAILSLKQEQPSEEKELEKLGFSKKSIVNVSGNGIFVKRIHDRTWIEYEDGFICFVRKSEIRNESHYITMPKRFNTEELKAFLQLLTP